MKYLGEFWINVILLWSSPVMTKRSMLLWFPTKDTSQSDPQQNSRLRPLDKTLPFICAQFNWIQFLVVSKTLLSYRCIVTVIVLWLYLTVSWVGVQCVIVVFPDHTNLLYDGKLAENNSFLFRFNQI